MSRRPRRRQDGRGLRPKAAARSRGQGRRALGAGEPAVDLAARFSWAELLYNLHPSSEVRKATVS